MRFTEFKTSLLESAIGKDLSTSTMMFDLKSIANIVDKIPLEDERITDKILANFQGTENRIIKQLAKVGIEVPDVIDAESPVEVEPEIAAPQGPAEYEPVEPQEPAAQPASQDQTGQPTQPTQPTQPAVAATQPVTQPAVAGEPQQHQPLDLLEEASPKMTAMEIKSLADRQIEYISFISALPVTKTFTRAMKTSMIADIEQSIKINKALIKQVKTLTGRLKASEAEKEIAQNFLKKVNGLLEALGNKVQEFTETTEEEKKALKSKERGQLIKKEKNAREFTKNLKHFMFGLIIDITLEPETHDTNEEEIEDFLEACVRGDVINMMSLITEKNGNVEAHVNEEYLKLFKIFKNQKIFSYNPGKTSGAIGPGEMALSMMGNPAQKAKKGDLLVGDQEIEVKAGSSSGGRLNSKKITKPATAWKKAWTPGIQKIVDGIPKGTPIKIKDQETKQTIVVTKENFTPNIINYKKVETETGEKVRGAGKEGARYNFNGTGLAALNDDLLRPFSTRALTIELFYNTFDRIILNLDQVEESLGVAAIALIDAAIPETEDGRDGGINVEEMIKAYTLLAYESYHLADGITTIMYLHTETLDYALVKDGEDLINRIGDDIKITGGFNFNDDQQTPTPAYLVMTSGQAEKAAGKSQDLEV